MSIDEYFGEWMNVLDKVETMKIMNWLKRINPDTLCPTLPNVFRAFRLCHYERLRVIFIGYDPYPDKYMGKPRATGILFGNSNDIPEDKLSSSLQIIKESAINFEIPHKIINFDNSLESWAKQGILMLNSSLTCEVNKTGSHSIIWRPFMIKLIKNMSERYTGRLYVLFGSGAQSLKSYINNNVNDIVEVRHPAYYAKINQKMPYSVFTDINNYLYERYGEKITWFNEL